MAIEKNNFKVTRFDSELSPSSRRSLSSDADEFQRHSFAVESDDDNDGFDDADSGAGSDDFDLLELGETGVEFCQVGNQTCSIPFELYDLSGLEDILSLDVWNEVLTDEERFSLTKYLPDMDQETYMITLKGLLTGDNFHFGCPIKLLFEMLKGGLCEPRVALYREGLNFFQKREHYHLLKKYQNNMVSNLCQARDAWLNCKGYSIDEKLRLLNIVKSQKILMCEKMDDMVFDSSERESYEGVRGSRIKDRKLVQKMGHHSPYSVDSNLDFPSRGRSLALESAKYGKQNTKGTLKLGGSKHLATEKDLGRHSFVYQGLDINSSPYNAGMLPRANNTAGYESGAVHTMRGQMRSGDNAEETYGSGLQHDRVGMKDNSRILKPGRNHELLRGNELTSDSLMGVPLSSKTDFRGHGRKKNGNFLSETKVVTAKPPNVRAVYGFPQKTKYPENVSEFQGGKQMKSLKSRHLQHALGGNRVDSADHAELYWHNNSEGEAFSTDSPHISDDWSIRNKKWKTERDSPELSYKSYKASSPQISERLLPSEYRTRTFEDKIRGNFLHNGGPNMKKMGGNKPFSKNEETESDSSEHSDDDDEENNPVLRSRMAYPSGVAEPPRSLLKTQPGAKKVNFVKKDSRGNTRILDGVPFSSKRIGIPHDSKLKQKGKMRDSSPFLESSRVFEDGYFSGLGKLGNDNTDDDDIGDDRAYKLGKNGRLSGEPGERSHRNSLKAYSADVKQIKDVARKNSVPRLHQLQDYVVDEQDDSLPARFPVHDSRQGRLGKKGQNLEPNADDGHERSDASLLICNLATRKRKGKGNVVDMDKSYEGSDLQSNHLQQIDDSNTPKKKAKRKVEADTRTPDMEAPEPPAPEKAITDMELETKPQKKSFTLITPTVLTSFSFSVMHLFSAVRLAMITPLPDDTLEASKAMDECKEKEDGSINVVSPGEKLVANNSHCSGGVSVPISIQEIVNRVRSKPLDPSILETQEPLQDLVRGVLKIFSSKTAPLGAKGWKALAVYEKSAKSWSWLGPVSHSSSDHGTIEEVASPEAWGLPHKMLVKLVDSFANWLKNGQETLQQIGSLPAPPLQLMQLNLDEKERFRDLRAQKSLNTISPSSEEVRAYFRKEEVLRYSIPDRAFSYTAADGKKSIVAPLRRCGGKPTSKARDHFMLKRDRPPHVTILCLVRDAAARLPGNIGTRADVCTLIRDSQYIVEDVSDAQVNQVVSGALDRLHYERDPCVQFDGERKLWVYLHREREEEDFEDDGTSSTKKWKRQKKDTPEQADQGIGMAAYPGNGEKPGYDLCSDLNAEPSCADDEKGMELGYDDARQDVNDDNIQGSEQGDMHDHPEVWESLGLNASHENKMLCQENSTNEDFDDETFGRERTVGLISASLL